MGIMITPKPFSRLLYRCREQRGLAKRQSFMASKGESQDSHPGGLAPESLLVPTSQ